MPKYRKLPVVIEAFQLPKQDDFNLSPFFKWAEKNDFDNFESEKDECLVIPTLEGNMTASPGDFIIKGINGEFYPYKPDIFHKTYEKVEK